MSKYKADFDLNSGQPKHAGIDIKGINGQYIVTLKSNRKSRKTKTTFSIIGLILWFVGIGFLLYQEALDPADKQKEIAFLFVCILVCIFFGFTLMNRYFARTTLLLTKDFIYLNRKIPIGLNYNSKRRTANLKEARTYIDTDTESSKPITGVELAFFDEPNLLIGQHLGSDERRWLIKRLNQITSEVVPNTSEISADHQEISLDKSQGNLTFTIPKGKWHPMFSFYLFMYVFAAFIFVAGAIYLWSPSSKATNLAVFIKYFYTFLAFLPFLGLFNFLGSVVRYMGKTILIIGKKNIIIKRSFMSMNWQIERPKNDLINVEEIVGFFATKKSRRHKQLVLSFKSGKVVKIGFHLTKQETEWLKRVISYNTQTPINQPFTK